MEEVKKMPFKEWRWVKMYTQEEIAKKLGVTQPTVAKLENGQAASAMVKVRFRHHYGQEELDKILEFTGGD